MPELHPQEAAQPVLIEAGFAPGGKPNGFIYGDDERLVAWAEERIENCKFRPDAVAIGSTIDGELVAVAVYDTFSTTSCFVHLAAGSRKWFTPDFATVAMAYPFLQCGFARINCIISEKNRASRLFTRYFGWTEEGRLREAGPKGETLILYGMLRRECRFLPMTFGAMMPLTTGRGAPDARAD